MNHFHKTEPYFWYQARLIFDKLKELEDNLWTYRFFARYLGIGNLYQIKQIFNRLIHSGYLSSEVVKKRKENRFSTYLKFKILKDLSDEEIVFASIGQGWLEADNPEKKGKLLFIYKYKGQNISALSDLLDTPISTCYYYLSLVPSDFQEYIQDTYDVKPERAKLSREMAMLQAENWDLKAKLNSKELDIVTTNNKAYLANHDELQNAKKQIDHLIKINQQLVAEIKRVKDTIIIGKVDNSKLKYLN